MDSKKVILHAYLYLLETLFHHYFGLNLMFGKFLSMPNCSFNFLTYLLLFNNFKSKYQNFGIF